MAIEQALKCPKMLLINFFKNQKEKDLFLSN